ncbi:hypothetical protein B4135_2606 [Caldibacillus debilis]|uniref:Uncharacterized protein n=1 Tax=Caldibacillus debilis TaxID=301148 RepID=A0A150LW50_9BACI|nr:hypothetical protein B4135_2606 [Caldibacillus debilis]
MFFENLEPDLDAFSALSDDLMKSKPGNMMKEAEDFQL